MMNLEHQEFFREFFSSRTRRMKDMLNPSLQHMTMVTTAIELWNQNDLRQSLPKFRYFQHERPNVKEWREFEEKTFDKVAQLPIPERLKREILSVISPIGVEIKNWWVFLQFEIDISKLPDLLVWTARGTVDRKRTSELLVKDENLELDTRYKIACIYCLENEIPALWKEIPEEQKLYFLNKENRWNSKMHKIVIYWTHYLFGQESELEEMIGREVFLNYSPRMYAFFPEVIGGNMVATKFFFDKLSVVEKNTVLYHMRVPQARLHTRNVEEYYSEVFFYFLSKMSEAQQVELCVRCPYAVLSCFLNWPFQPFFMPLAEQVITRRSIHDDSYVHLLQSITRKIAAGGRDFDYRKLFCDFWNLSPLTLKRLAVENQMYFPFIVNNLLEVREKSIIAMLFEHANTFNKKRLILSGQIIPRLVLREKWDLVKDFLELCDLTKEVMVEMKHLLMFCFSKRVRGRRNERENGEGRVGIDDFESGYREYDAPQWVHFFQILGELIVLKSDLENVE